MSEAAAPDVKVTHPDVPDGITVPASRAKILARQGWTIGDTPAEVEVVETVDPDDEEVEVVHKDAGTLTVTRRRARILVKQSGWAYVDGDDAPDEAEAEASPPADGPIPVTSDDDDDLAAALLVLDQTSDDDLADFAEAAGLSVDTTAAPVELREAIRSALSPSQEP